MPNVEFTLDDYMRSFEKLRKPNIWAEVLRDLSRPGVDTSEDELAGAINRILGIFRSMTIAERNDRTILFESRLRRIARGAGVTLEDVRDFLKQFEACHAVVGRLRSRGLP